MVLEDGLVNGLKEGLVNGQCFFSKKHCPFTKPSFKTIFQY